MRPPLCVRCCRETATRCSWVVVGGRPIPVMPCEGCHPTLSKGLHEAAARREQRLEGA